MSDQMSDFLKKALSQKVDKFGSLRGPHNFSEGDWKYTYTQEGDISGFYGYEEIHTKEKNSFGIE